MYKILCVLLTVIFCTAFVNKAEKEKPIIYLIGDSTVKNGDGSGRNGQWGGGDFVASGVDENKGVVENHAIGGRSSRTFLEEGRWEKVLEKLKPGDYVMVQFGHNDGGSLNSDRARGTLKGSGEETQTVTMEATGEEKTIHTYGWYIRKYVREAKEKGATPIVVAHIPRNIWKDGKVGRIDQSYGKWCKEVCEQENALFLDLNELVASKYEEIGESTIRDYYFKGDHTHTSFQGAQFNAEVVRDAITGMNTNLKQYLKGKENTRKYNFNPEWKLYVGDIAGAEKENFDDSDWKKVTLPCAYNEDEAFKLDIKDLSGGIVWYRKEFSLPTNLKDKKVFIEFEGIRQAGEVYINGKFIGLHENGVMAFGHDLTPYLRFGDKKNTIALKIDNDWEYRERETNSTYQWNNKNFNANYGGIPKNVFLHVTDKLYQTLPLYNGLGTTGIYVYAKDIKVASRTADMNVEAEIKNEYKKAKKFSLEVSVYDMNGRHVKTFASEETTLPAGGMGIVKANAELENLHFWSWGYGYLYDVKTSIKENGKVVDEVVTKTGFRKTRFGEGMVWLNDRVIQLKGYAQRTSNEWPSVGMSVPAWLSDYSNRLMVESNANLVRWMHVCPWKQDIESCDRVGLIQAMPVGDAEKDIEGRQWEHRVELMREAIIYNRNNPSILFYESGNTGVSEDHMRQMKEIRNMYDPHGGRAIGSREMLDSKVSEYGGEMLYINKSAAQPMWSMEYSRDEGLRKYWDEYSYPYHKDGDGPLYRNADASVYNRNQDSHAIENVKRWYDYWKERPGTVYRKNSGGVKIIFSDSNTHYRGAENYRRSGVMDAMRIKKDGFYAHQVMWDGWVDNEKSHTHIIGHWNYDENVVKDIYVVSSMGDKVELFINGESKGYGLKEYEFLHTFKDIAWEPGKIKAVTYGKNGRIVSADSILTAGEPAAIRLSLMTGARGLMADGTDLALVEVEVVDKDGRRCPLANHPIQFNLEGEAEWRGGIAQGPDNYILSTVLPVECGVNRALIRSTTTAGDIRLVATAEGLQSASLSFNSMPFKVNNGISEVLPVYNTYTEFTRWETPSTPSFTSSKVPVTIRSCEAGSNQEEAYFTYDDNERTTWSNDGKLSTAWIKYEFNRQAEVDEISVKMGNWRNVSYPIEVYAGETLVYQGITPKSLGYVTLRTKPVLTDNITIKLSGSVEESEAFGQIVELDDEGKEAKTKKKEDKGLLRIVEIEFYELLNQ
ncbi:MAG: GDSL-type esterase/lipase family protein [Odoribacter sp.]|nr:GDSL-type esterase/lipase family protein [Odoribacter sp.]